VREQAGTLDDVADVPAQLVRVLAGDVLLTDQDPTLGRLDQPVDHLHRRGLAAPRRSDEHHDLAGRDGHRDVVDGRIPLPWIAFRDAVEHDLLAVRGLVVLRRLRIGLDNGGVRHGFPSRWSAG
jgi:hypothetical protein